jgi:hypothetical protein
MLRRTAGLVAQEPVKIRDFVRRFGQILREDRRGDPDSFDR